jgi:D-serine deaminase-like pyridoxal phosphate-dependent protein
VIIDETRARANIHAMADKARRSGAAFRPHFKTHQSPVIGRWFTDEGVDRITVSSVRMAEQFAECGWTDITIAFLLNPLELPRVRNLAEYLDRRGGRLGLTVDSVTAARMVSGLDVPVAVWLKVDTGYGRTGIRWDDHQKLHAVLAQCRGMTVAAGLLTHSGHSYEARGDGRITEIHNETIARMNAARENCAQPDLALSFGDTPCCSVIDDLSACDEIRPGNFVFYDLMQLQIGSCTGAQLAAAAVCPVVGIYSERNQVVVHGGAVHLSTESLQLEDGRKIYGIPGSLEMQERSAEGDPGSAGLDRVLNKAALVSLSQEHGVIECAPDSFSRLFGNLEIGDLVVVWPVHSCLMCDLQRDLSALPGFLGKKGAR